LMVKLSSKRFSDSPLRQVDNSLRQLAGGADLASGSAGAWFG